MGTEKDKNLAFLDTAVSREPDGRLTTSIYRKPTHTNQYLAYDSHHPQSVKRGIIKCLYERAKRLLTKPSVISEEKNICHLFCSETTLRSQLVRPKDAVDPAKQDGVVYRIPCKCGKVYIGGTGRPMQDRIKNGCLLGSRIVRQRPFR